MDQKLQEKLAALRELSGKISAVNESIAEKQQLAANLNRTAHALEGMPEIQQMADRTRAAIEKEIEAEKEKLAALKAEI